MSSYRNIQEQSGAVPDSKPYISKAYEHFFTRKMRNDVDRMNDTSHICQQSGCRNTFLNQEGYCFPHHTARNTEGMFTNEERK